MNVPHTHTHTPVPKQAHEYIHYIPCNIIVYRYYPDHHHYRHHDQHK